MFEYATGLINVLEKKSFDKTDQERMLKAPDRKEAFMVLFDTDMGEVASKENDLEKILSADTSYLKKVLLEMLRERKEYFWFLFLRFDALNLKIILKKIWLAQELKVLPSCFSLEPYEKIEAFVVAKKNNVHFHQTINRFVAKMTKTALGFVLRERKREIDPEFLEEAVDKAYFETKLDLAQSLGGFIVDLVRLEIDIANIKALLSEESLPRFFIKGGNLTERELESFIELEEGEILMDLKKFLEVFGLGVLFERYYKEHKDKKRLEADLQGFLSERIFEKERNKGMGFEKVLGFFQRKLNAQINIRLIMFAKEHNIPLEKIEPLLLPL